MAICRAEEWQRDGRGLWAMRTCISHEGHQSEHTFGQWRYRLVPPALRLAKEATNGWACYAKRESEHKEIARLHREIAAMEEGNLPQECRCDCVNCVTGNHTGCYYAPSICPVKFAKRDIQP